MKYVTAKQGTGIHIIKGDRYPVYEITEKTPYTNKCVTILINEIEARDHQWRYEFTKSTYDSWFIEPFDSLFRNPVLNKNITVL